LSNKENGLDQVDIDVIAQKMRFNEVKIHDIAIDENSTKEELALILFRSEFLATLPLALGVKLQTV